MLFTMAEFYHIVSVTEKSKLKKPFIVPSEYVTVVNSVSYVKYLEPPWTNNDVELIYSFVIDKVFPPPPSWSTYRCKIIHSAATYKEALLLMEPLLRKLPNDKSLASASKDKATPHTNVTKIVGKTPVTAADVSEGYNMIFDNTPSSATNFCHASSGTVAVAMSNYGLSVIVENDESSSTNDKSGKRVPVELHKDGYSIDKEDVIKMLFDVQPLNSSINVNETSTSLRRVTNTKAPFELKTSDSTDYNLTSDNWENEPSDKNSGDEKPKHKRPKLKNKTQSHNVNLPNVMRDITQEIVTRKDLNDLKESIIHYVDKKFKNLDTNIAELKQITLSNKPVDVQESILTFSSFKEMYSYNFPLQNIEDFDNFNADLKTNRRDLKNNLNKYIMSSIVPKSDLVDDLRPIMKLLFSRNLLMKYTAQKQTGDKLKFNTTSAYFCIEESVKQAYKISKKDIDEKTILQVIGLIFYGVKDWDGFRTQRYQKG